MATALTTLVRIQLIAKDDAFIQALAIDDPLVEMVLEDVARHVTVAVYGDDTEPAQRYCAAHWLSIANQPVGGRGPSRSFTLPYINQKTVYGATQFGLQFMEFRSRNIVPFAVIIPPSTTEPAS